MIFSTISPKALTFSSMGDLRASERKLANSSAISNHHSINSNNSNKYISINSNKYIGKNIKKKFI